MATFLHRHRGLTPYLLLAPGVAWLAIFFLVPLVFLGYQSLQSGTFPNYEFTWEFSNFSDAISAYREQLVRSFLNAGIATVVSLLLAGSRSGQAPGGTSSSSSSSRPSSSPT